MGDAVLTSRSLLLLCGALSLCCCDGTAQRPFSDLGPNVIVVSPNDRAEEIQATIDRVYAEQQHSEFGEGRYAFLFLPGKYHLNLPIGFYTQVLGVGATPDAVRVVGDVHVDAALQNNNATTTFWRSAEGFSVVPDGGTMQWAVSQAVAFRRMHVLGNMVLNQKHGWASGGWMSDTVVDGTVDSGTQQQWISRNAEWAQWAGSNWNMVFVGTTTPPEGNWPKPPFTKITETPVVREKPFLVQDESHRLAIWVPKLQRNSNGVTWHAGNTPGRAIPWTQIYVAHADRDSAGSMNAALARGKSLLLTPGIYTLQEPLRVRRKDTAILGLGFATLRPRNGTEAMTVADVDGVTVSGLLFDAGEKKSPSLLRIGEPGSHQRHEADPVSLHDVFFREGGAELGRVTSNLIIDSNDVIVDHTWIWRADHGRPGTVGWTLNESDNGLTVNGNNVTVYGLFVEHHQKYQVLWNGERGRTYFYQSEIPYDPPTQAAWQAPNGERGWASYKVADGVIRHEAWGLGIYSVFRHPEVVLDQAIQVPDRVDVRFHHMITVALDTLGAIRNVINSTGGSTGIKPRVTPKVDDYPKQP